MHSAFTAFPVSDVGTAGLKESGCPSIVSVRESSQNTRTL
jgi:hypothetical protein